MVAFNENMLILLAFQLGHT